MESAILAFINRTNDAYVFGHTVHDLINDHEYQKLVIKHGQPAGLPLGNQHILPGYWFSVFVAPYRSLETLLKMIDIDIEEEVEEPKLSNVQSAIDNAKSRFRSNYHESLIDAVKSFKADMDELMTKIDPLVRLSIGNFPEEQPLKRFINAIATGSYKLSVDDDGDFACTFYEDDMKDGYTFEVTTKVAAFNQFCMDFIKQMAEMLWPLVEGHKKIAEQVSSMTIGEVFWKHVD